MTTKPGGVPAIPQQAPTLTDFATADDRFEALFLSLVQVVNYTRQGVAYSDEQIGDLARLLDELDLGAEDAEAALQEMVLEGEVALADLRTLPTTVALRMALVEAQGLSAVNNARAEMRYAVQLCECGPDLNLDGTCGIRFPGEWYQGGIYIGEQTLPDGRVVDVIADVDNKSDLMAFGPAGDYPTASSLADGRANTGRLCAAGAAVDLVLAHSALGCELTFSGYYLPSQRQLERLAELVDLPLPVWSSTQLASGTMQVVSNSGVQQLAMGGQAQVIPFRQEPVSGALWRVTQDVATGGPVREIALRYDGTQIAVGVGSEVRIYSRPDFTLVTNFSISYTISGLHYSPDNSYLFVGSAVGNLRVFDTSTWQEDDIGLSLPGAFLGQTVNPAGDETLALFGTPSPGGRIYSLPGYTLLDDVGDRLAGYDPTLGYGATYSHDGSAIAVAGFAGDEIRVVSTADWSQLLASVSVDGQIKLIAYTKDDAYIGITQALPPGYSGSETSVMLLDTSTWTLQPLADPPPASPQSHSVTDNYLAVMTADPQTPVTIYKTSDWSKESTPRLSGSAWVSAWLDGTTLAVGYQGGLAIIERAEDGQEWGVEDEAPLCQAPIAPEILAVKGPPPLFNPVILSVTET